MAALRSSFTYSEKLHDADIDENKQTQQNRYSVDSKNAQEIAGTATFVEESSSSATSSTSAATATTTTTTTTTTTSTGPTVIITPSSTHLTLLQAVINGDVRRVRKIVVKGVSAEEANQQDSQGRTPLGTACSNGMVLTVEFLSFIAEIDPNQQDNEGSTPLSLAAQAGQVDCMRILLKEFRNVKIDHQNKKGYTALIQAAINGRIDCCKLLLEAGANPFLTDKIRKKNALQWAEFCGRGPCAAAIREMTGSFPALMRHLVSAGQSVLTRHRSVWGSDSELDTLSRRHCNRDRENRRGTISRMVQRSKKWIGKLKPRRKQSYNTIGSLVSVAFAISGPGVSEKMTQVAADAKTRTTVGPTRSNKCQSPPWGVIPAVQIIAPCDEFQGGRRPSLQITHVNSVPAATNSTEIEQVIVERPTSVEVNPHVAWGQNSSAPSSPVLSSRSAERAHRRRFAQRSTATTGRYHVYQQQHNQTSFHDAVMSAAEHFNAISMAREEEYDFDSAAAFDDNDETIDDSEHEQEDAVNQNYFSFNDMTTQ